jgi:nicotinamidase-related amidase
MMKTNKIKPALLVIDTQNASLKFIPDKDWEFALVRINYYIGMFREHDCPIIRIYHYSKERGPKQGTADFEFAESVAVRPDDPMVIKNYMDAFNKTDLDKVLRELGCNTLFLCGLSAAGCVLATLIGAFNHDYNAFLVKDAIVSHKPDYTASIETIFEAVGMDVIKMALESTGA